MTHKSHYRYTMPGRGLDSGVGGLSLKAVNNTA